MMKKKSGKRTMLMPVLMSAPGPLIVGAGLMVGKSTTQLADFLRRSAELLALVVAFIVYSMISGYLQNGGLSYGSIVILQRFRYNKTIKQAR